MGNHVQVPAPDVGVNRMNTPQLPAVHDPLHSLIVIAVPLLVADAEFYPGGLGHIIDFLSFVKIG